MKYIRTAISEQETTINVLYEEQIIIVYSSRAEIIKQLTKLLGMPTTRYKKNKTYWTGATWELKFNDIKKIEKILLFKAFIDSEIKIKEEKIKKVKKETKKSSSKKIKEPKKLSGKKKVESNKTKKKESKKNTKTKKESTKNSKKTSKTENKKILKKVGKNTTKIKKKLPKKSKIENQIEFEQVSLL